MTDAATTALPLWLEIIVAVLVLAGAGLALLGSSGLLRLPTFFERVHAPTLATSWGTGATVLASIVCFSALSSRPAVPELLIGVFITVTTPVTLALLARASLYRERAEGKANVPPRSALRGRSGGHDEPD